MVLHRALDFTGAALLLIASATILLGVLVTVSGHVENLQKEIVLREAARYTLEYLRPRALSEELTADLVRRVLAELLGTDAASVQVRVVGVEEAHTVPARPAAAGLVLTQSGGSLRLVMVVIGAG